MSRQSCVFAARAKQSEQAGLPEWQFTLPMREPEALPPRRILYSVHVGNEAT
jgi:hypothetical protein